MNEQNKNDIKEILANLSREDYEKDVDLHLHTCCSDGKLTPEQILADAKKKGYRLIAISDHNTIEAHKNQNITDSSMVLKAVEFDCWYKGVLVHILGYGMDITNQDFLNLCAKTKKETEADIVRFFNSRKPKDVIEAVHKAGGVAILAHPACYWAINLDKFIKSLVDIGLDGVEAFYLYRRHRGIIKFHKAETVEKIGRKYNLLLTGGSDSHREIEPIV